MREWDSDEHLTGIQTRPELLQHGNGEGESAIRARQELVMIYYGAAFRYLMACLRDRQAAEDLAQHFASRLMEGNYIKQVLDSSEKPTGEGRFRFRDYLKRSLQNLVSDHRKKSLGEKKIQPLPEDSGAYSTETDLEFASDQAFLTSIREELIWCAWQTLAQVERDSDTPYESVLRLKAEQPRLRAAQIAIALGSRLGKPFTEAGVRQLLRRAREKFSHSLLDHAETFLQTPDAESVEQLLIDLGLLELCKEELNQRRKK
jgi:DNA-directed RNA polymerase specialized sigma24 family protein